MRVYIDTEFNGFGGELISMALVTDKGAEWYRVLQLPRIWNDWAVDHVLPVLNAEPVGYEVFSEDLEGFLRNFDGCEVIADHPADFQHFAEHLNIISARQDFRIPIECTMTLLRGSPEIKPEIPHNALSDAIALRDWHQSTLPKRDSHPFDHPPHRY